MSCNNCSSCSCETENVQQFVPGKEYAVGEFFKYGSGVYKAVDFNGCGVCDLVFSDACDYFVCTHHQRSDSIDVGAILYDSEE